MKRVRLLQIAVYIVFAALFLQNAAGDVYRGFMEGYTDGVQEKTTTGSSATLIPYTVIDAHLLNPDKHGKLLLNDNYKLEDISINAGIRVNNKLLNTPWWVSTADIVIVLGILFLLVWLSYIINKIIFNIYEGTIFDVKSVSLIWKTGILLIAYSIMDYINQLDSFLIGKSLINSPITVLNTSQFNFEILICGLLVLIIAEAFKQGAQLKQEQELTI
jgi:hypothetical protein